MANLKFVATQEVNIGSYNTPGTVIFTENNLYLVKTDGTKIKYETQIPNEDLLERLTIVDGELLLDGQPLMPEMNFLALTDTPDEFTGNSGKAVVVNLLEDALEFQNISVPGGEGNGFSHTLMNISQGLPVVFTHQDLGHDKYVFEVVERNASVGNLLEGSIDFDFVDRAKFVEQDAINGTDFVDGKVQLKQTGGVYDNTQGYYVNTTNSSQIGTLYMQKFNEVQVLADIPLSCQVKYLVSFDSRATWKYWNGSLWVTVTGGLSGIGTRGMALTYLSPGTYKMAELDNYNINTVRTVNFAFQLSTTDQSMTPTIDQVVINYNSIGFDEVVRTSDYTIKRISNTQTELTKNSTGSKTIKVNIFDGSAASGHMIKLNDALIDQKNYLNFKGGVEVANVGTDTVVTIPTLTDIINDGAGSLTKTYSSSNINNLLATKAASIHTHDDRYYTEGEVNGLLNNKANVSNTYTKSEVDSALSGKSATSHTHTDLHTHTNKTDVLDLLSTSNSLLLFNGEPLSGSGNGAYIVVEDDGVEVDNVVSKFDFQGDISVNNPIGGEIEVKVELKNVLSDSSAIDKTYSSDKIDTLLNEKANTSHTHADYSLTSHTHAEYAATTHTHADYATIASLGDYLTETEGDANYAAINHTHDMIDGLTATVTEINYLSGTTGNIQSQIDAISSGAITIIGTVDTAADIATTYPTPSQGNAVIVLVDETHGDLKTMYVYNGTSWVYVGETTINERDFSVNPLNINTETTGEILSTRIGIDIARTADVYTKTEVDDAVATKSDTTHTHTEFATLLPEGDGTKYLANDGTFKDVAAVSDFDTMINKPATYPSNFTTMINKPATYPSDWSTLGNKPSTFAPSTHSHDDRYYTEGEVDTKLGLKSDSTHTHTDLHTHDNKTVIDNITDVAGVLKYNGVTLATADVIEDIAVSTDTTYSSSKINSLLSDKLDTSAAFDPSNKTLLASYTQSDVDITEAIDNRHTHTNATVINNLTQSVINNSHEHLNSLVLDYLTDTSGLLTYNGNIIVSASEIINDTIVSPDLAYSNLKVDELLDLKADQETTYTKGEVDTIASGKAPLIHLHGDLEMVSRKGQANGYAALDANAKVPSINLPDSLVGAVKYIGTWDATANTPTLANGTGTQGNYYVVGTAGNTTINGYTDWQLGDWIIYNGATWDKVDNSDKVSSVNSKVGVVELTTADVPVSTDKNYVKDSQKTMLDDKESVLNLLSVSSGNLQYNSINVVSDDTKTKTIVISVSGAAASGLTNPVKLPFAGTILSVSAICGTVGTSGATDIVIEKSSYANFTAGGSFTAVHGGTLSIAQSSYADPGTTTITSGTVTANDVIRANIVNVSSGLANLTIEVVIKVN
jgi:hypothetical protein